MADPSDIVVRPACIRSPCELTVSLAVSHTQFHYDVEPNDYSTPQDAHQSSPHPSLRV